MLFTVGKISVEHNILECDSIRVADLVEAFGRYLQGDWGDQNLGQCVHNDVALTMGQPVIGVYQSAEGTEFWIQREPGRTTVLLPNLSYLMSDEDTRASDPVRDAYKR